eukprot:scaffold380430_cov76-Cyclotella_meneghiniana.AAC.6
MERAEAAMACIGSFLTTTEKALFGVAIDPNGPTRAGEMVAGKNPVTELDLGDVDAQLASRLTDDHLKCILVNIDAKKNLKVLKLTHCTGITGSGLEPLRDSCSMELIDLSLLELHECPPGKWQLEEGVMRLQNDYSECLLSEDFTRVGKTDPVDTSKALLRDSNHFLIASLEIFVFCATLSPERDPPATHVWNIVKVTVVWDSIEINVVNAPYPARRNFVGIGLQIVLVNIAADVTKKYAIAVQSLNFVHAAKHFAKDAM